MMPATLSQRSVTQVSGSRAAGRRPALLSSPRHQAHPACHRRASSQRSLL